ncbi:hypothetical protein BDZ91DRAFT_723154 [Kalaharituber pfeilii]|nr:hypothetical protein BDZ91DRAFT_723154 [Kalaharituber pfeilii]
MKLKIDPAIIPVQEWDSPLIRKVQEANLNVPPLQFLSPLPISFPSSSSFIVRHFVNFTFFRFIFHNLFFASCIFFVHITPHTGHEPMAGRAAV